MGKSSADESSELHPWPQRCANIRTSYNPDADLQTDALTLTPADPRWPAFLAWVKEQQLFTSTLVGVTLGESADSGAGIVVRWAAETAWEKAVRMPWGQALAHIIAERNWRDVDFPEFFAERGGLYDIDLAGVRVDAQQLRALSIKTENETVPSWRK